MKKINYLYLLLLTVVTTLWGCSDFEDLNKDDTKLPELGMSHVGAAFAYSQYWGMYADRYEFGGKFGHVQLVCSIFHECNPVFRVG